VRFAKCSLTTKNPLWGLEHLTGVNHIHTLAWRMAYHKYIADLTTGQERILNMIKKIDITQGICCWHCPGMMYHRTFRSCFGEEVNFFECTKCHFTLDEDFVANYGPDRPSAA
jgi:hypothetical protein